MITDNDGVHLIKKRDNIIGIWPISQRGTWPIRREILVGVCTVCIRWFRKAES